MHSYKHYLTFHVISASCNLQFVPNFDDGSFRSGVGYFSPFNSIHRSTPIVRQTMPIVNKNAVITYWSTGNMNSVKYNRFSMAGVSFFWCYQQTNRIRIKITCNMIGTNQQTLTYSTQNVGNAILLNRWISSVNPCKFGIMTLLWERALWSIGTPIIGSTMMKLWCLCRSGFKPSNFSVNGFGYRP